jgi:hypothetical protein
MNASDETGRADRDKADDAPAATRRGRDARKWDRRLENRRPNRVVLDLLGARTDFYERKEPELRRVRGKGEIFMRPISPTAATAARSPRPTTRRGRDARERTGAFKNAMWRPEPTHKG